jgi:hypothetical protein
VQQIESFSYLSAVSAGFAVQNSHHPYEQHSREYRKGKLVYNVSSGQSILSKKPVGAHNRWGKLFETLLFG